MLRQIWPRSWDNMLCTLISQQDKMTRMEPKSEALRSKEESIPASFKKKKVYDMFILINDK